MPALILMYHDLAEDTAGVSAGHRPYVLEPATFRAQMRRVAAQAVPVPTVTEWCSGRREGRAVLLTFDDGHVSNHDEALPILVEQGLRATFFVTAGRIGDGTAMNWTQIRAMHAAGMEIGSHTVTHRPPSTLDDAALRWELDESRRILEDGLGALVTSISSPTGFFNPRMRALAREAGYRALCFGTAGLAADDGDPLLLKRVAVKHTTTTRQFEALLQFDGATLFRLRFRQAARDLARTTLGPGRYLRLRRALLPRRAQ
jgi:peptidoglycan/xylan/chitin deacetylase (PgdA/CDA1 family)